MQQDLSVKAIYLLFRRISCDLFYSSLIVSYNPDYSVQHTRSHLLDVWILYRGCVYLKKKDNSMMSKNLYIISTKN